MKICKIKNCNNKYYAKEYCKKHYTYNFVPRKYNHQHKCKIKDCNNGTTGKYCSKHLYRIQHKLSLDLSVNCVHLRKGNKNNLWRGGVAEYPNHSLMKKNRLIILMNNPKCEVCGEEGIFVHHKDGSKINHSLNNLMVVCRSCHAREHIKMGTHWGRPKLEKSFIDK